MKKQFVTYEIALKLKKLWFDEPCFCYYGNISQALFGLKGEIKFWTNKTLDIFHNDENVVSAAPLWQQVIDWFREKYNISVFIDMNCMENTGYTFYIGDLISRETIFENYKNIDTCYEAREQAILKAIELITK